MYFYVFFIFSDIALPSHNVISTVSFCSFDSFNQIIKKFYINCEKVKFFIFCFLATGWPERENIHTHRLQEIIVMYKSLVLQEKQEKVEKDKKKERKFMTFTVRTLLKNNFFLQKVKLTLRIY